MRLCAHCCQRSACHCSWGTGVSSSACHRDRHLTGVVPLLTIVSIAPVIVTAIPATLLWPATAPPDRLALLPAPGRGSAAPRTRPGRRGRGQPGPACWRRGCTAATAAALAACPPICRGQVLVGAHRVSAPVGVGQACEQGQLIEGNGARYRTDLASRVWHVKTTTVSTLATAGQRSTDQISLTGMHPLEGGVRVPVCAAELWHQHRYTGAILIVYPGQTIWVAWLWLACQQGLCNRAEFPMLTCQVMDCACLCWGWGGSLHLDPHRVWRQ